MMIMLVIWYVARPATCRTI